MGSSGSTPNVTLEETLAVFSGGDQPCTPLTATEVADDLGCTRRTAHRKLEQLAERGDLHTKKTGARSRVWWQSTGGDGSAATDRRQSELEQFGDFVSAVEDYAIFMLDPEGRVTSWNEGAERIKGYEESEILGEHFSAFYTADDVERGMPARNLEAAEEHGRIEDEGWRVRDDGSEFWANVVITAIRDDDGSLRGFTKVTRDMTERREREEQLRRERELTERVLEAVPALIAVVEPDGRIVRTNSRLRDLLGVGGRSDAPVVGDVDVYDADGQPVPPEERPYVEVFETGEPTYDWQCQVEAADGARRWLSINAVPLRDGDGAVGRAVVSGEDITELKEHERQLEQRKSELETELNGILGRVSDAFYALDEEWRFTHVNERAEEIIQRSEGEVLGESVWEVFPEATEGVIREKYHEAMDTKEPVSLELYYESVDAWVEINAYPSETGLSVYFRDVSERVERERRLERFERMVETVNDGVYATDGEGRFVFVNDAFVSMSEHTRAELLGSHGSVFFGERFVDTDQAEWRELVDGERDSVEFEADITGPDGETHSVQTRVVLLEVGDETGRVGVVRDITERVQRERALEESERLYRTLVENVPSGGIGLVDHDLRYEVAGGEIFDVVGLSAEEVEGRRVDELYSEELVELLVPRYRAALEGESSTFEGEVGDREFVMRTLPVRDESGEVFAALGMTHDITERKERERELKRYETLIEESTDVNAILDPDGTFRYLTPSVAHVLGYEPGELSGENAFEYVHPDDVEAAMEEYGRMVEEPDYRASAEFRFRHADGSWVWLEARGRNLMDDPDIGNVVAYTRDVTERKRYEQQLSETVEKLEESNERLEQFAYAASHDLQEPLRMVSNYLQLVESRYADDLDADGREFIEFAVDGAERMHEMIDDLLAYSRVDTRAGPLEPTDSGDVVESVLANLQVQIEEHDAEIDVDPLPTVAADRNQLEQVFQNLVSNAIKYRGEDPPEIEIGAERDAGEWVFRVADNGIGMDPEHADRVFEVFRRLHTHEEYPGTGIGLALCKKIVERHGGDIRVESEPGEGSTFYFTIPASGDDRDHADRTQRRWRGETDD